ncbi:hypothetical protein FNI11_19585 [Salmonella enterica subsp. salamae]|nr:hypothetical protein [Salmonella enterica subsp. salamae]ECJ2283089.1 hypothetical protein [Salmonella enterica subsp. salamae]
MKIYQGAVLYIDILGISALTKNEINITDTDFSVHNFTTKSRKTEQVFCAKLLMKFRRILKEVLNSDIHVAQLSDCAFIWSKKTDVVLEAARKIMWSTIKEGILCRGGISYGEIVEPDKTNKKLGQFVCGKAVTNSAKLEHTGKGTRIFLDDSIPRNCSCIVQENAFCVQKNPTDCTSINEFRWWLFPENISTLSHENISDRKRRLCSLMDLISSLRHSPLFRWNSETIFGRQQIASTIDRISHDANELQSVHDYKFEYDSIINNLNIRDEKSYNSLRDIYFGEIQGID